MADKDLSVKLGVDIEVNAKKLDAIAKHINMTGDQLQEALSLEVDATSLQILGQEIGQLEARAVSLGQTLSTALSGNPAGQQELISNLREQLSLANKIKETNAQAALPKRSGKQVDIKQAIAQELFGDKGVDFNVGAFKSEIQSRVKGWSEDFGDDAIELVDVLEDSSKTLLQDINTLAKEAANEVGVKFKSSTEMLTGFNANTLEDGADTLAAGLKAVAENISLSGNLLINGQRFAEKDLVQSIRDFEVDSKGVFTISPAMFLDGYRRVIAKLGKDLVTVNSTDYKDLTLSPFEGKAPDQASENVIAYLQRALDEIRSKPRGQEKIDQKIFSIEEKILNIIFENALKAAERTLTDSKGFDRRQLDIYAPSADVTAIGGSADTENLMRYAEEAAAKSAYKDELALGLQPGTAAKFLLLNFSTRFQDAFQELASEPNALFDPAKVIGAIRGTTFVDDSGALLGSALSRGLDNVKPISEQILENPNLLRRLIGVDQAALQKKIDALIQQKIAKGTFDPSDMEEAIALAYVQSLIGQIQRTKPINYGDAVKASELQAKKDYEEQEKEKSRAFISSGGARRNSGLDNLSAGQAAKQKEINQAVGEANALRIALLREGFVESSVEALVAKRLQSDIAARIARVKAENKAAGQERARQIAIERQAGGVLAPPAQIVTEQPVVAEAAKTQSWIQKLAEIVGKAKAEFDAQGGVLMAALDTEFNPALQQAVSELSLNIMTASGEVVDLLSFIHIPFDKEALALEKSKTGAKSVQDLMKRAQDMGLDMSKLGDIEDKDKNFEQLRAKVNALVSVLSMLDSLGVGLTGSNFKGAERANITKLIEYVNKESEARGLGTFQVPRSLSTPFDSVTEFKKAAPTSKEISLVTEGGKVAGLGNLIAGINRHFPEFLEQFREFFRMTEQGPQVLGKGGVPLPAHYAQADVVMSQIVKAFFDRYAGSTNRVNQIIDGVKPSKPAAPTPPSGGGPGGGGPVSSGPMDNRPPADLTGYFHSTREMEEQLASRKSLTEDERFLIEKKLELLKKDADQVTTAKQLVDVQTKIAELRTADAIKARSLASKDFTEAERQQTLPGFIGPLENKPNVQAARDFNELIEQEKEILRIGRARESQTINEVLTLGRYSDVKEKDVLNTRKQLDAMREKAQAGKEFAAQIQAQLKAELEAQKAVQKANREQLNQWVTARYALYDVGNFYQNVAQQMFRLSREIFNTTQVFRSFETAFTSVERAMQLPADAAVDMRDQFIKLSEVLPVTFEDLSRIATLGAQMGIGAGGIEDFTSTVARFSAITTISADTVAQKFGRIAELANIDSSQFENLGSAVAFAGVNAVATETEILTLSESIAAVSEMAGFMPSETIGMATALASVGIQAEQARGVFTRVFADIDRAVSRGGSELNAFAKVSGMSSDAFAKQWGTEGQSYEVFRKLLGGLGSSADATKAFDALNIVETREINTLIRLANNLNVVDQAVSDSNESFADATFLASSFGKTADNLDAQLVIFKNNLDSLIVSITQGLGPGLSWVVERASGFLEVLKNASKSNAAQVFLPLALAITGIGAAFAATAAGVSKMVAQIYAFRVANINSMNSSATEITSVAGRVKQLTGAYSDLIEVRSGLGGVGGPDQRGTITPINYNAKDIFAGQRAAFAEFARTRDFASARQMMSSTRENALLKDANILMISANKTQGVSIALARQQADAVQRIIDARRQEIAALAEKGAIDGVTQAQMLAQKFYIEITKEGARAITASEVAKLRETRANTNLAISERQLAASRLANIRAVNAETATATRGARLGMTGILNRATGVLGFIGIIATAISFVDMLKVSIEEANKIDLMGSGGGVQSLRDAMAEDTKVWRETKEAINVVQVEYTAFEKVSYAAYDAITAVTGANDKLKKSTNDVTEIVKSQTVAIGENTKNWILNAIVGNEKVNEWLKTNPGLFNDAELALQSYGTSFSALIKGILENPTEGLTSGLQEVDDILDDLQDRAQERLEQWYKNNPEQLDPLLPSNKVLNPDDDPMVGPFIKRLNAQRAAVQKIKDLLNELAIAIKFGLDTSAIRKSLEDALGGSFEEVLGGATKAATKTLTQWAGEVAQVIQSALTIRRQKQVGLDGITKGWSDLRKRADDARKAVKKAQDQLNSLNANRSTLQYQLDIAIKYGDSKRAMELQAKLDENTTSLADANDQLKEAQDAASTELKGNSDAAIENRAKLRGLVDTYVPYIQALENSTVKGETFAQKQDRIAKRVAALKKEFESQALALGFAQTDLAAYLGDFDAMGTVVKNMPNTVTVKVDGQSAALRALREFAGSANAILSKVAPDASTLLANILTAEIAQKQAQLDGYSSLLKASKSNSEKLRYVNIIDRIGAEIKTLKGEAASTAVKKASGGYISGPGTPTSDSIPAMLSNGEYVVKASTVRKVGVAALNDLNQNGSVAKFASGGYVDRRDAAWAARGGPVDKRDTTMASRTPTKLEQWIRSRNNRLLGNSDWQLDGKRRFGLTDAQIQGYIKSQTASQVSANAGRSTAQLQLNVLAKDKSGPMEAARVAAYFTPVIGSLLSASDASRAFGAKDILGGSLSTLGTIPGIGGFLKLAGLAAKGSKAGSALGNAGDKVFKYGVDKPAEWISKFIGSVAKIPGRAFEAVASKIESIRPKEKVWGVNDVPENRNVPLSRIPQTLIDNMKNKIRHAQDGGGLVLRSLLQRSETTPKIKGLSFSDILLDPKSAAKSTRLNVDSPVMRNISQIFKNAGIFDEFSSFGNLSSEIKRFNPVNGFGPKFIRDFLSSRTFSVKTEITPQQQTLLEEHVNGLLNNAQMLSAGFVKKINANPSLYGGVDESFSQLAVRAHDTPYAVNYTELWEKFHEIYQRANPDGYYFQNMDTAPGLVEKFATPDELSFLKDEMLSLAKSTSPMGRFLEETVLNPITWSRGTDLFSYSDSRSLAGLSSVLDARRYSSSGDLLDGQGPQLVGSFGSQGQDFVETMKQLSLYSNTDHGIRSFLAGAADSMPLGQGIYQYPIIGDETIDRLDNFVAILLGGGTNLDFVQKGLSDLKYGPLGKDAEKFIQPREVIEDMLSSTGLFHGWGRRLGPKGEALAENPISEAVARQMSPLKRNWNNLYAGNLFTTESRSMAEGYGIPGDPRYLMRLGVSAKALQATRPLDLTAGKTLIGVTDPDFVKDVVKMFASNKVERGVAGWSRELPEEGASQLRDTLQASEITNLGLNFSLKAKRDFIAVLRKHGYNSVIHDSTHRGSDKVAFWIDVPKGMGLLSEAAFPSKYTLPDEFVSPRDAIKPQKGFRVAPEYFSQGGLAKGTDTIPAMLSPGEFIMSARSVSNYGVDFMNAMNQSRVMYAPAQPSMAQSGGGSSVVYLSPDDRALLRAAIDRPVNLYADSTRLAQSVNNGNKVLAQRGSI